MRHNDNCDLTIQAVAKGKPAFVDVAHSYGSATPTFHKYIEAMICCLVR